MNPTAQQVKSARLSLKLTQKQAAQKLYMSTHTWKNYESGRSVMNQALFEHFHCPERSPDLLLQRALSFIADLNGMQMIKGNGIAERDMRQRSEELHKSLSKAVYS